MGIPLKGEGGANLRIVSMAKVRLEELFNITEYEKKARTKYEAIVVIGKYARYLLRRRQMRKGEKIKGNPVIVAARLFVEKGIPYRRLEEGAVEGEGTDRG